MVEVREAKRDDRRAVRDVHVAAVRGLASESYDDAVVEAWSGDEDRDPSVYEVDAEDAVFLVAVDEAGSAVDDEVVGFGDLAVGGDAAASYDLTADAELRAVYVAPDRAGEGVGTALLEELERRGRARGVSTVVLTASANAVGFYESQGYERVERKEYEFGDGDDATGPVVVMRKRL